MALGAISHPFPLNGGRKVGRDHLNKSVAPFGATTHSATGAHATTPGTHAATGTHTSAPRWRFIRQGNAALLGTHLHLLVMFGADSFTLFLGFCRAHFGAVSRALLLRHQLRAVYLLLVLSTNLVLLAGLVLLLRLILADNQR